MTSQSDKVESILQLDVEGGPRSSMDRRMCILVLGMHRSGTSALTGVLSIAGAKLPANLMGADHGNETGHYEPLVLSNYNNKILAELGSHWDDWRPLELNRLPVARRKEIKIEIASLLEAEYGDAPLFVVKEPRICRFADLFLDILEDAAIDTRSVLMFRNPLEVAKSLERRNGIASEQACLLWLCHVLDAEAATREGRRVFLSYDSLLADWKANLRRLTQQLDVSWLFDIDDVAEQVDSFLEPALRHHVHSTEDILVDPMMRDWIAETYSSLLVLQNNSTASAALDTLSRIRKDFSRATPVIARIQETALREKAQLEAVLAGSEADLEKQSAALSETQRERDELQKNLEISEDWRRGFKNSTSWRITRPMRKVKQLLDRKKTISEPIILNSQHDDTDNYSIESPRDSIIKAPVGMLGMQERRMLYYLARDFYKGQGLIIDAGSLVGASALSLACGLSDNKNTHPQKPTIYCFDHFQSENIAVLNTYLTRHFPGYEPSQGFRHCFDRQTEHYKDWLKVEEGNFLTKEWRGKLIEILFIDICKNIELNSHVIEQFFGKLIPKHTLVIHQDYHQPDHPWIHVTMQALRDYFDVYEERVEDSIVLRYLGPPPTSLIQKCVQYDFSDEEQSDLMDAALESLRPENRGTVALAKAVLAFMTRGQKAASDIFEWAISESEHHKANHFNIYVEMVRKRIYR